MAHRIRCAEVWGGIQGDELDAETCGIRASLFSQACDGGKGGDIYYFSVCGNDMLTRIVIADVVGHGEQVSRTSQWIYDLLVEHMSSTEGQVVLSELNTRIAHHGLSAMTTAAIAAFYLADSNLYLAYAGHHPVLVNRRGSSSWIPASAESGSEIANLPLGVDEDMTYHQHHIGLSTGDRLFLYTDGVIEAPGHDNELFGEERLVEMLEQAAGHTLPEIRKRVLSAIRDHAGETLSHDDVTFMAVEIS